MALRLETFSFLELPSFYLSFAIIVVPTIYILAKMGLYHSFIRHVSTEVVMLVAIGTSVSVVLLILTKITVVPLIPWTVPIIYAALLFIGINGIRFVIRSVYRLTNGRYQKHIAIYGAGAASAQIIHSLKSDPNYMVRMVIDDSKNLQGERMFGHTVMSFSEASSKFDKFGISTVLLAIPSASFSDRKKIISRLSEYSLDVKTIPGLSGLINGSVTINEFKDIEIEDLLEREMVKPDPNLLSKNITGKTVLVTGAGGSIGSELCRQILKLEPDHLLLLDISEFAIYNIFSELESLALDLRVKLSIHIGSVSDRSYVSSVLDEHNIETIYHAAAYKHVPLMEQNLIQAIKNNSLGTLVIAEEALRTKVSNFTLISTDKAVNPTNVMGASKRLAERICQSMNGKQTKTQFSIVRFGNVLGSSGSVVTVFKKQIAAGGPITLTHPDITRYFMTIGEAVQLVIQAGSMSIGGEVFILDMGRPIKIMDLAFKMVNLSGLTAYFENNEKGENGDIAIRVTGLRPGEKMYEELSYGDNLTRTFHPRVMTVQEAPIALDQLRGLLAEIEQLVEANDTILLTKILVRLADFTPSPALVSSVSKPRSKSFSDKIISLPLDNTRG
ncbi:polysaccharide biosynthesis protein [Alphaproteobacteria bacterium LSUCC0684]